MASVELRLSVVIDFFLRGSCRLRTDHEYLCACSVYRVLQSNNKGPDEITTCLYIYSDTRRPLEFLARFSIYFLGIG